MTYARGLLKCVGLEPERLRMLNMSSADGALFAEMARQMTKEMKELGPSPVRRSRQSDSRTTETTGGDRAEHRSL